MAVSAATHPDATAEQLLELIGARLGDPAVPAVSLAVRPDELPRLAGRLLVRPGGRWVGDHWLDEPAAVVAMQIERAAFDLRGVLAAYADRTPADDADTDTGTLPDDLRDMVWTGRYVLAVPRTVADLASWHSGGAHAPASHLDVDVPLAALPTAAAAIARLWRCDGLDDLDNDELGPLVDAAAGLVDRLGTGSALDRALAAAASLTGDLLAESAADGTLAATLAELAR